MLSKTEEVWRHLIDGAHHGQRRWSSVSALASELGLPSSTTHQDLEEPRGIGILEIRGAGGLRVLDPGRLLILWAGRRRLDRDVRDRIIVPAAARTVKASLDPGNVTLGGFGAVVERLGYNNIADYSTVMVYAEQPASQWMPAFDDSAGMTEVVVLKPDPLLRRYGRTITLGQAWVDLFRAPGWQASRFVFGLILELLNEDNDVVLHD
jgi:hypothetical protein